MIDSVEKIRSGHALHLGQDELLLLDQQPPTSDQRDLAGSAGKVSDLYAKFGGGTRRSIRSSPRREQR